MKSERKQLIHHLLDSIIMRDTARARALLEQGADLNAKDTEHGETPLIVAVKSGSVDIVRLLLEAGAKVDARDDWGRTELFYAPVSSETFAVLLRGGADVHVRDEEANTILMRKVSESATLAEVEQLLRLGVDPSLQNDAGETALDLAEGLGLTLVAERLRSCML